MKKGFVSCAVKARGRTRFREKRGLLTKSTNARPTSELKLSPCKIAENLGCFGYNMTKTMDSGHVELEILNCCYKSTVQFYAALLLKA
jgi:hypothetical protein